MVEIGEICDNSKERTIYWKITEFFSLTDEVYYSSDFSFAYLQWYINIYPNGDVYDESDTNGHISVYLSKHSASPPVRVAFSFSLLTSDGKNVFVAHKDGIFADFHSFGFPNFVLRSELMEKKSELAPSDTLTLVCSMKWLELTEDAGSFSASSKNELNCNEEDDEANEIPSSKYKGMEILSENLKQMFLDGRMCDIVLKTDGKDFNAHKFIMAARSPVFASMFQHDLEEKKTNEVDIPDCTAESFEAFLHYLYTGSAEALSTSNVYNVYYAADKYQVDDLKEKCVKFMVKNISVETFCDVIDLSLRHGEAELQKTATNFFSENIKGIVKTVQWMKYMEANTVQANELLIKFLKI